ncbi:hypothetical protein B0H17DRAFT_1098356 [Mycena rosella]|uniref:Uncharacterized protein n=1 Tax=Mycena rosella TaxID=1033263 RepID=A0AAD7CPG3_MYCRO|nr:hypothetical protein B0H17DRAFT_1098356 [Mycena rosella]
MPVSRIDFTPSETARSGDALHLDIPPPYNHAQYRHLTFLEKPGGRKVRPLPEPPATSPAPTPPRPLPRRRASGGCFIDLPPPVAVPARRPPRAQVFYVCNPSDSPATPARHEFPSSLTLSIPGQSWHLPINIIPATPLPPPTPGLMHSRTNLTPPQLDSPSETMPPGELRRTKMHRRLGGSVGAVPASVLAELRTLGEERGRPRSITLPNTEDPDKWSDEDGEDDEDAEDTDDEEHSWVVGTATRARVVRPTPRNSMKWVQDLGGDRWIADRYSSILRSL